MMPIMVRAGKNSDCDLPASRIRTAWNLAPRTSKLVTRNSCMNL